MKMIVRNYGKYNWDNFSWPNRFGQLKCYVYRAVMEQVLQFYDLQINYLLSYSGDSREKCLYCKGKLALK